MSWIGFCLGGVGLMLLAGFLALHEAARRQTTLPSLPLSFGYVVLTALLTSGLSAGVVVVGFAIRFANELSRAQEIEHLALVITKQQLDQHAQWTAFANENRQALQALPGIRKDLEEIRVSQLAVRSPEQVQLDQLREALYDFKSLTQRMFPASREPTDAYPPLVTPPTQ